MCLILLKRYGSYSSQISILIMEILMQVRYVVLPISYYLSGNEPFAYNSDYGWSAMAIMIYEMICVILLINYLAPYYFGENRGVLETIGNLCILPTLGPFLLLSCLSLQLRFIHNILEICLHSDLKILRAWTSIRELTECTTLFIKPES